ncbi:MAG TPA: zf-HC2 domain-containing protein [Bryobacteraceae bacterium]|nr:zf-HC2 domain-containing protein [Bryobacteraceae bacterium]
MTVRRKAAAYAENALSQEERREMRQHMQDCQVCARESERYQRIREALRSLPRRTPPSDLTVRLRVAASQARTQTANGASDWTRLRDRLQLALSNLMRPLALPLAGGLCAALVLFSALVPTFTSAFASNKADVLLDVPTMLTTEPSLKYMAPIAFAEADAIVDLNIDDQGRIVNYSIVSAPGQTEQLRRRIENNLLFTEFWPATAFGKPIAGTVRISFHNSSHVEVKG